MSYLAQLAQGGGPVGAPPATRNPGTPPPVPPAQPHLEPAPYDAAKDPTWRSMLAHGPEEFRNFINGLDDGARQMLHTVLTSVQNANPFQQAANALVPPKPGP